MLIFCLNIIYWYKYFVFLLKKHHNALNICIALYKFSYLIFINVTGYPQ